MSPNLPSIPPDALPEVPSSPLASPPNEIPQKSQKVTESHTSPSATAHLNPSPSTPPGPTLSDRQLAAVPLILAGLSDTDIAAKLGLVRETVNRWRHRNPAFIAALNAHRHQRHAATADRYDRLLNQAMDTIERVNSYKSGWTAEQLRVATSLLRSANLRPRTADATGPTNPADILQSLLSQGLPPDTTPDNDPPPPQAAGGAQGEHEGCTGVARGGDEGSTGVARPPA